MQGFELMDDPNSLKEVIAVPKAVIKRESDD